MALIDLVYLSKSSSLISCNVLPPLANSDHNGLLFCLQKQNTTQKPKISNPARIVWNYENADFCKARYLIEHTNWESLMSEDVNTSLSQWQATFLSIMERCIPKIVLRSRKNLPWLTKQLIQAARKKRRLFQQSKKTGK